MILTAEDGKIYLLLGGDRAVIGAGGRLEVDRQAPAGPDDHLPAGHPVHGRHCQRPGI